MFYNTPTEQLSRVDIHDIATHSFIKKEIELLKYVTDRHAIDPDLTDMDFSLYEKDTSDRHGRIPLIEALYKKKQFILADFRDGKDVWKNQKYHPPGGPAV